MKYLLVSALAFVVTVPAMAADSSVINPLEIPKYVREWFSGRDFTGKPKMSGHYHQSRLNGTNFQGMKFAHAEFEQCDLADANMKGAIFGAGTKFYRCTLNGADLQGADFAGATIDSVNFRGADLRNVKGLRNVQKVNFQRADLRGADLSKIRQPLVEIEWDDAIYDAKTKFPAGFNPVSAGAKASK
jgi:uncharacterized protein YjbI with pentapeptide repeats